MALQCIKPGGKRKADKNYHDLQIKNLFVFVQAIINYANRRKIYARWSYVNCIKAMAI